MDISARLAARRRKQMYQHFLNFVKEIGGMVVLCGLLYAATVLVLACGASGAAK